MRKSFVALLNIYLFLVLCIKQGARAPATESITTLSNSLYNPNRCGRRIIGQKGSEKQQIRQHYYHVKVMGGNNAEFGEHPWAVALFEKNEYVCTGTLISKKHVVTAAHCFLKKEPDESGWCKLSDAYGELEVKQVFKLKFGSNCLRRSRRNKCAGSPAMKTAKIIRLKYGPFFERGCIGGGDIALIEMSTEIGKSANYACLPFTQKMPAVINLFVSIGWGANPVKKLRSMNNLQTLETYMQYSEELCLEKWPSITKDIFCTPEINNANTCSGDSGGGTLTRSTNGRWVVLGVLSFGSPCSSLLEETVEARAQGHLNLTVYANLIDEFAGNIFRS